MYPSASVRFFPSWLSMEGFIFLFRKNARRGVAKLTVGHTYKSVDPKGSKTSASGTKILCRQWSVVPKPIHPLMGCSNNFKAWRKYRH